MLKLLFFFYNRQFSVRRVTYTVNRFTLYGKCVTSKLLKETKCGKMQSNRCAHVFQMCCWFTYIFDPIAEYIFRKLLILIIISYNWMLNITYLNLAGTGIAQSVYQLATGLMAGGFESSSPGRGRIILLSVSSRLILGATRCPIHWVPGTLSTGVKQPRCEADHSPSTSAEVKKTWIYTSTPLYVFKT
jgi:hypothetical protein